MQAVKKQRSTAIEVNGHHFASAKTAQRYQDLRYLQMSHEIKDLTVQYDGTRIVAFTYTEMATGTPVLEEIAKRAKYNNVKTEVDGMIIDSKAEARRYEELKLLLKAGEISDLTLQPRYPLKVNGVLVATYIADFSYVETKTGRRIVEDVKSEATKKLSVFRMKAKLMMALYGVKVIEVMA